MNYTFSFKRFWLLVRRHGAENLKVYAISWGVISLFILFFCILSSDGGSLYTGWFAILFFLTGCVLASNIFGQWADFGRSSTYLLLPATTTEKFMSGLFYSIVIFIPVFTLLYFLTGYLFFSVLHPAVTVSDIIKGGMNRNVATFVVRIFVDFILALLLLQSVSLICAAAFKKRQFIISSFLLVLLLWIYLGGINYMISTLAKTVYLDTKFLPFMDYGFAYDNNSTWASFHFNHLIYRLNYVIWIMITGLLYLSAWFKLREREL
jgi:hypothetical protein